VIGSCLAEHAWPSTFLCSHSCRAAGSMHSMVPGVCPCIVPCSEHSFSPVEHGLSVARPQLQTSNSCCLPPCHRAGTGAAPALPLTSGRCAWLCFSFQRRALSSAMLLGQLPSQSTSWQDAQHGKPCSSPAAVPRLQPHAGRCVASMAPTLHPAPLFQAGMHPGFPIPDPPAYSYGQFQVLAPLAMGRQLQGTALHLHKDHAVAGAAHLTKPGVATSPVATFHPTR